MLASIISTIEKSQDKGAGPDLRVEYSETRTLLKAPAVADLENFGGGGF